MKKKILVVDNNTIVLEFMKDLFIQEGHKVLTAEDGLTALDVLETYVPDVIFVDLIGIPLPAKTPYKGATC